MIEINLLREEKGGNPDLVRESQRRRHKPVEYVDDVIALDQEWRRLRYRADNINKSFGRVNTAIKNKKKAKEADGTSKDVPASVVENLEDVPAELLNTLCVSQLMVLSGLIKSEQSKAKEEVILKEEERNKSLCKIGNIVHQDVPVSNDEHNNETVRSWGEPRQQDGLFNHVDLMIALDMMDTTRGSVVAGNRGYFLKGAGVLLKMALENYSMSLLAQHEYQPTYVPFFMTKSIMSEVAQLEQFDEELYKVVGDGEDKYLIATSEQPMAALHRGEWLDDKVLPIKYSGISTCFRKEAGSHGRDTLGIFRVHQFEKVEQFCYVSPKEDHSWSQFDSMISLSEQFYQSLGISYNVVSIVSGELNLAAAMKYDLEGWFPASKTFRELVSCSNCTDYQARRLGIRYGTAKAKNDNSKAEDKEFVHMLNSTMCALTRAMCVILETYQTPEGVRIPDVLQPYMGGVEFLRFITPPVDGSKVPTKGDKKKGNKGAGNNNNNKADKGSGKNNNKNKNKGNNK